MDTEQIQEVDHRAVHHRRIWVISGIAGIVLAALTIASLYWLRPAIVRWQARIENEKKMFPAKCITYAQQLDRAGLHDRAFKYFQMAVVSSDTEEDRAFAGLAIGEHLLDRARVTQNPYQQIMARQYLEAALDIEQNPQYRFRIYRVLLQVVSLMQDRDAVIEIAGNAMELASTDDMRVEFMLPQIDIFMQSGEYEDVKLVIAESEEYMRHAIWGPEFVMRKAIFGETVLTRSDWFEKWCADRVSLEPGASRKTPEQLRFELMEEVLDEFRYLRESGVEKLANEALFRRARLYFVAGDYQAAEKSINEFILNEPSSHQDEALLMMIKLERVAGKTERSQKMMTQFFQRFSWNRVAAAEMSSIIDKALEQGRVKEALGILDQYMHLPIASEERSRLLAKAGSISMALGLHKKAKDHFDQLLSLNPDDDLAAMAMYEQAQICIQQKDFKGAREWLTKYLRRFPRDSRYGDALFALFDIYKDASEDDTSLISAAVAAATARPDDDRALKALLLVAEKLEGMGLPSVAQKQYNKILLLHYVVPSHNGVIAEQLDDESVLARAMIGNARCFLAMGDDLNAEHMFRELCNNLAAGQLRSEAAYYWATIASGRGQRVEAVRRLDIVDVSTASSEIVVRVMFERVLLDIASGHSPIEAMEAVIARLAEFPANDRDRFTRRVYETCFGKLIEDGDIAKASAFLAGAVRGPHSKILPLEAMSKKLARTVLDLNGIDAFADYLQENGKLMAEAGLDISADTDSLMAMAQKIEEHRKLVENYL